MQLPARDALDAVFLDAGNTLVGLDPDLVCEVAYGEGLTMEPEAFLRAEAASRPAVSAHLRAGTSSEANATFLVYVESILERLGVEEAARVDLARRLVPALRRAASTQRLWSRILPGVHEGLALLRDAGLRLIVVSNSDGSIEQGLVDVGLRGLVDGVIDSARVGVEKPDPGIFGHALTLGQVVPARALHVGDLYDVDVVGARAAGLQAALLDPYGDWLAVDCPTVRDLADLAERLRNGAA